MTGKILFVLAIVQMITLAILGYFLIETRADVARIPDQIDALVDAASNAPPVQINWPDPCPRCSEKDHTKELEQITKSLKQLIHKLNETYGRDYGCNGGYR